MFSVHGEDGRRAWSEIRRAANDNRGGDRWKSRGDAGAWFRIQLTPRKRLFTPYRVAKGPSKDLNLKSSRFACGVYQDGTKFEFYDEKAELLYQTAKGKK